jgi:RNA recognition motif-containing protein
MSFTVFLGNLPTWVTADDIQSWLTAENLVADHIKVIRNPETQESKGFAFIEAPNGEEMQSIIKRFDRAPLEDRLLRANPAQPPKGRAGGPPPAGVGRPAMGPVGAPAAGATAGGTTAGGAMAGGAMAGGAMAGGLSAAGANALQRRARGGKKHRKRPDGPPSAFAEELAKAL